MFIIFIVFSCLGLLSCLSCVFESVSFGFVGEHVNQVIGWEDLL